MNALCYDYSSKKETKFYCFSKHQNGIELKNTTHIGSRVRHFFECPLNVSLFKTKPKEKAEKKIDSLYAL